ncbi:MAG: flavoprotein, partial [bacterium]
MAQQMRLIVGISGASGIDLGVRVLELLAETDIETHLILSKA